jgi:hypothetical protein
MITQGKKDERIGEATKMTHDEKVVLDRRQRSSDAELLSVQPVSNTSNAV